MVPGWLVVLSVCRWFWWLGDWIDLPSTIYQRERERAKDIIYWGFTKASEGARNRYLDATVSPGTFVFENNNAPYTSSFSSTNLCINTLICPPHSHGLQVYKQRGANN